MERKEGCLWITHNWLVKSYKSTQRWTTLLWFLNPFVFHKQKVYKASDGAQKVRTLGAKSSYLSSTPEPICGRRGLTPTSFFWPPHMCQGVCSSSTKWINARAIFKELTKSLIQKREEEARLLRAHSQPEQTAFENSTGELPKGSTWGVTLNCMKDVCASWDTCTSVKQN